jgi:hypothetical protein
VVEQLADLCGVNLHIINVSRLSPLEVEGVQMPHGSGEEMILKMLPATFWTSLKARDIVLLDEFLRGFPEVYNGLLDILTSRRVGAFRLPQVFIIAASNSTVSYDKALEDRLMHIPVADVRTDKKARKDLASLLCAEIGLLPEMAKSSEMTDLIHTEVDPMYEILDAFKANRANASAGNSLKGRSPRKLIGLAKFRETKDCPDLSSLISMNNHTAMRQGKAQYVVLLDGKKANIPVGYEAKAEKLSKLPDGKLSPIQAFNLNVNLQLIELEEVRIQKGNPHDDEFDNEPDLDDLLSQ